MSEFQMMGRRQSATIPQDHRRRESLGAHIARGIGRENPIYLPLSALVCDGEWMAYLDPRAEVEFAWSADDHFPIAAFLNKSGTAFHIVIPAWSKIDRNTMPHETGMSRTEWMCIDSIDVRAFKSEDAAMSWFRQSKIEFDKP